MNDINKINGIKLIKWMPEYGVYDSCIGVDKGWLPMMRDDPATPIPIAPVVSVVSVPVVSVKS